MTLPRRPWRDIAFERSFAFVGTALFPGLASRLRWPTRLGPRGLLLYIAANTLLGFGLRVWVIPAFQRSGEQFERTRRELRAQLGREPTNEEILTELGLPDAPGGRE